MTKFIEFQQAQNINEFYQKYNTTISPGPFADYIADVDLDTANNGYYALPGPTDSFVKIGIATILHKLKEKECINYYDLGGGHGLLTNVVTTFLKSNINTLKVNTTFIDGNPSCATIAKKYGFNCITANLESIHICQDANLVTMRGVNHYNSYETQLSILKNTYNLLKRDGVFVSSICSGNKKDCELQSAIANLPELTRAFCMNQIHATCVQEYMDMLRKINFKNIQLAGYSQPSIWKLITLWERTNKHKKNLMQQQNDHKGLEQLKVNKFNFYTKTLQLINKYNPTAKTIKDLLKSLPNTKYPIISATKN